MCEFVHVSATFWANGWERDGKPWYLGQMLKLIPDIVLIKFNVMFVYLEIYQIENDLTAFL